MRTLKAIVPLGFVLLGNLACSSEPAPPTTTSSGTPPAGCTEPTAVPCSDQVIQEMAFMTNISTGAITNAADGTGFSTSIDATAGGLTPTESYVYGRFGETGLEKVDISDEDSLDSMDWDIAFRRYVVRINSGHSGPSCVAAARLVGATTYDALTTVPADLMPEDYLIDDYFTASCVFKPDGSGLPNAPATALSGYWEYPSCVKMTGNVYVVQLADASYVKLTVTQYYGEPTAHDQCQACTTMCMPPQPSGSANFVVRWAHLQ